MVNQLPQHSCSVRPHPHTLMVKHMGDAVQTLVFQWRPTFSQNHRFHTPPDHPVLQERRADDHHKDTEFRKSNTITSVIPDLWSAVGWKTNQIPSCVYDVLHLKREN